MGIHARVIGICGSAGSGKNTVADMIFSKENYDEIIDVDVLGHQALENQKEVIIQIFGEKVINDIGKIDRKKLGKIVFSNSYLRKELEKIVHPWMKQQINEKLQTQPKSKFLINAALLYTMKLDPFCDAIIIVLAPWWIRLWRLWQGRKISFFYAFQIIISQENLIEENPKNCFIKNHRSLAKLKNIIDNLKL